MYSTGFMETDLKNKCHECKYYQPLIKDFIGFKDVTFCRGACKLKNRYKQRTETCKKFERKGLE